MAGLFGYLAIAGGLDLPAELGSMSLQGRARIGGGFGGRPLAPTDRLPLRWDQSPAGPDYATDLVPIESDRTIRVVLGPQDDSFSPGAIEQFLATEYTVSAEADRMGYRLAGPAIPHEKGFNIVSDGLVAGSIQVPGSGVPIVMMADHQTTGGYPKIATVVSVDLGRLAQRRPGRAGPLRGGCDRNGAAALPRPCRARRHSREPPAPCPGGVAGQRGSARP
jgi:biotin-dependent carboxylase-like uncharacterized protein